MNDHRLPVSAETVDRSGQRRQARTDVINRFQPNEQLEDLLRLRDSARSEDRALYEKVAIGRTRLALELYERDRKIVEEAKGEG